MDMAAGLEAMMKAQLQLAFTNIIRRLRHVAQLRPEVISQAVSEGPVGPVSIESLHGASVADVAAAGDE